MNDEAPKNTAQERIHALGSFRSTLTHYVARRGTLEDRRARQSGSVFRQTREDHEVQLLYAKLLGERPSVAKFTYDAGAYSFAIVTTSMGGVRVDPFEKLFSESYEQAAEVVKGLIDAAVAFYRRNPNFTPPTQSTPGRMTMDEKRSRTQDKDAQRLALLEAIYELADGNENALVPIHEAFQQAGIDGLSAESAMTWLTNEGLATKATNDHARLLHDGVAEYEKALKDPEHATAHFQPSVINTVFNIGTVGNLQTGANSTINQTAGTPGEQLPRLLAELRAAAQQIDGSTRDEVTEVIDSLEAATKKPKINATMVKGYLDVLGATVVLAPKVADLVKHFFP